MTTTPQYLTNGMVQFSEPMTRKEARAKALEVRKMKIYSVVFPAGNNQYSVWIPAEN